MFSLIFLLSFFIFEAIFFLDSNHSFFAKVYVFAFFSPQFFHFFAKYFHFFATFSEISRFLSIWLFLINQFLSIWYKNQYFTHISVSYADTSTILTYDFVSENPVIWYKYIQVIFLHVLFSPKLLWIPHIYQRIYNSPKHFSSRLVLNFTKIILYKITHKIIT